MKAKQVISLHSRGSESKHRWPRNPPILSRWCQLWVKLPAMVKDKLEPQRLPGINKVGFHSYRSLKPRPSAGRLSPASAQWLRLVWIDQEGRRHRAEVPPRLPLRAGSQGCPEDPEAWKRTTCHRRRVAVYGALLIHL